MTKAPETPPQKSLVEYETEVKNGKLLVVAHGTPQEVELARRVLDQSPATTTLHAEPVASFF